MKVLFDTSVLVAAMVESHPMHGRAFPWLKRAKAREFDFLVASHTLAELYAVLTTLPVKPRISPGTAWRLVHENVEGAARVVSLSAADYRATIKRLSERGVTAIAVITRESGCWAFARVLKRDASLTHQAQERPRNPPPQFFHVFGVRVVAPHDKECSCRKRRRRPAKFREWRGFRDRSSRRQHHFESDELIGGSSCPLVRVAREQSAQPVRDLGHGKDEVEFESGGHQSEVTTVARRGPGCSKTTIV